MPDTIVRVSIPVSIVSFNNFFVLAIFSAAMIVATRISIFPKSSNAMLSFCGSTFLPASFARLARFVAASFSSCASITLSSIFSNSKAGVPIRCPGFNRAVFPS